MKRGINRDEGDGSSSRAVMAEPCKRNRQLEDEEEEEEELVDMGLSWGCMPQEILLHIFQYLPLLDRAYASQVCRGWNLAFHMPELWRCFEFELNQPASSYLKATHPDLIKQIIKRHSNHLQYVSFKVRTVHPARERMCRLIFGGFPLLAFTPLRRLLPPPCHCGGSFLLGRTPPLQSPLSGREGLGLAYIGDHDMKKQYSSPVTF